MSPRIRSLALLPLLLASCGERAAEKAARESREKALNAQRQAEALLTGMDRKVSDLRAKAGSTARGTTREGREALSALEEKLTAAKLKLDEVKAASRDSAGDAAEGLRKASEDLEKAYREASSRFK